MNKQSQSRLEKRNQLQYEQMVRAGSLKPTFTLPKLLALFVALLVHCVTLLFVYLGIRVVVSGVSALGRHDIGSAIVLFIIAAFPFAIAVLLAPRVNKMPRPVLPRETYAALYRLADAVAECLHAPQINAIVLSSEFNASYQRAGYCQTTVVTIGLALWAVLDDQEKVALLAHEFAHAVNGDFQRNFVVGSAIKSLLTWHRISGVGLWRRSFVSALMLPLHLLSVLGMNTLYRLLLYESRRAEYLADALAADVSGTDAVSGVLTKLNFSDDFRSFVATLTEIHSPPESLFERFRGYISTNRANPAKMQQLETDRSLRDAFYSWTHPPLAYRKRFLTEHPVSAAEIILAPDDAAQLKRELEPGEKEAQLLIMRRTPPRQSRV